MEPSSSLRTASLVCRAFTLGVLWEPRLVGEGTLVCSLHLTDVHGRRGHKKPQVTGSEVQGHWVRGCRSPG